MRPCPHCGKPVSFWRLWSSFRWTPYRCPHCDGLSEITWLSRFWCCLVGVMPIFVLGFVFLIRSSPRSKWEALLIIAAIALTATLLMGFLLARFGRFLAIGDRKSVV